MYKRKLAKQHGNLSFPWCVLAALYAGCFCEGMFLLVCVVVFTTMEAFYGCWTVIAVVWLLLLLTHGNKENKKHCLPLPFLTFSFPLLPPSLGFFNITNLYRIIPVPCTSFSSSASMFSSHEHMKSLFCWPAYYKWQPIDEHILLHFEGHKFLNTFNSYNLFQNQVNVSLIKDECFLDFSLVLLFVFFQTADVQMSVLPCARLVESITAF